MRTPREAIVEILGRIDPLGETEDVPLEAARGRVLARAVSSDVDLPPFEKSAMDGFAVRAAEVVVGEPLSICGESKAGTPFLGDVPPSGCVEIYTGAEVPEGLDAVVMVEESERDGARVRFAAPVKRGQNINHLGEILTAGEPVFDADRRLTAADLAVLAAVGCDPVPVRVRPAVSILTTGDELVPPSELPGPGQIREGNTFYLRAAAEAFGCRVVRAGRVSDDEGELESAFAAALDDSDALITSGGVSMGKYDLVGKVLEKLGVEPILHKVAIKPGKPIWFGQRGRVPVLGLPGNPVSSMLGFQVFVRPALARLAGEGDVPLERLRRGRWLGAETRPNWRQQNLPVTIRQGEDGVDELEPRRWLGSADMVGVAAAGGLAVIPPETVVTSGEMVDYRPLD